MPWTRFMDMYSGGGQKEDWPYIYIEAPIDEAISVFYSRFGHNPYRVTCTCCGDDYSVREDETLEQATGYERGCARGDDGYIEQPDKYRKYVTMQEYIDSGKAHFIYAHKIKPEERDVYVPEQGYVWQD